MARYGRRAMAGWRAYRYGTPETRPAPPRRRLSGPQRDRLAKAVVRVILRKFDRGEVATKFGLEAACRAGIRAGLCLRGWQWSEADGAAADVTLRALDKIGARRPTWKEGQPEYTQEGVTPIHRTRCANCGGLLEEGQRKFCSAHCGTFHRTLRAQLEAASEAEAYDVAAYAGLHFRYLGARA